MKNFTLSLLFLGGVLSASATTSLNQGGNIRVNSGWSNNLPSVTNEGTVEVDGVISGSDVFGYGAGAIVNHTAGNIVAQVIGTKRRGFNMNGGGTWVMSGGSITVRYINANGPNSILDLNGGTIIIDTADTSVAQFQMNNGGQYRISGDVVLDGSDASVSPLVGSGSGYEISSSWTGSWIQGNHSGMDWKTVLTGNPGYRLNGVSITSQIFDDNFLISSDGQTLTLGNSSGPGNGMGGGPSNGPITVYLLGGQSNMEGSAPVAGNDPPEDLPLELYEVPEILLYVAGSPAGTNAALSNRLITLQPHSLSTQGLTIGPEIGFGERINELCPGERIALLKYSFRGTNLHTQWDPGANNADTANWGVQYTAFVNTINNGLAALRADGWEPEIEGMLWVQGEADAVNANNANAYGANLSHLIGRVREQFAADAAPSGIRFVAGQVLPAFNSSFSNGNTVRQAILDVDEDSGASLSVTNTGSVPTNITDHPLRVDNVHYNWIGILALGRSMAYEMLELEELSYSDWSATHQLAGTRNDDDDHDGVPNVLEFALGGNPNNAADQPTQSVGVMTVDGERYASYSFSRNLNASNTVINTFLSFDLVDWMSFGPTFVSSEKQPDGSATFIYRDTRPLETADPPRAFFRIGVE